MEQIIGLLIVLIFWGLASFIRKAGKQSAAQKAKHVNAAEIDNANNSSNISQNNDLEKLIKMFTGLDIDKQTIEKPSYNYVENVEKTDEINLEGSFGDVEKPSIANEEQLNTISNLNSINYSTLANENKISENQNFPKNVPTSKKSISRNKYDFDLKKAVIHSIILEKRFDF